MKNERKMQRGGARGYGEEGSFEKAHEEAKKSIKLDLAKHLKERLQISGTNNDNMMKSETSSIEGRVNSRF